MISICIPYYTGSGHTKRLVDFVLEGVQGVENTQGVLLDVKTITQEGWNALHAADAIIFATPTYLGSGAASFKAFMDQTDAFWLDLRWNDKIAAGVTISATPSGDKLTTLTQLSIFAAQHGMIWVGQNLLGSLQTEDGEDINECGSWLGLMATSSRDKTRLIREGDAKTARLFGERIAKAAHRWKSSF